MPVNVELVAAWVTQALVPTVTTLASAAEPSAAMTWFRPAAEPLALLKLTISLTEVPPV